jgi:glycosyltransferase involved in cell wall biosynthesis
MRIVYALTSLGTGGAERQVLALAARMADRGHVVALLVLKPPLAEECATSLDTVCLQMRRTPSSVLAGWLRGYRFLRKFRPDILHSHSFHANFIARALKLALPGTAAISTVHNVYEGGWHRMLAYRLTDGLSCRTAAVCGAALDRFVRLKAVPRRKGCVLSNGTDCIEFSPSEERRSRMRAEMGAMGEFVWLAVGRIAPAKDYPNLLRALALVRRLRSDAQLWIAGAPRDRELTRLMELSTELGLEDSVRFLGLRGDLPALFDAADGYALSSAWEGMPLALGEAMAMAKPAVATDVGGVRELAGETCAIVEAKNPQALAAAMLETMNGSAEERQSRGRAARRRIVNEFSIEARTGAWEALYRDVLAAKPR